MFMKKINLLLAAASSMLFLASCDSYLDKLPDDRAELNTIEKVQNLLSTAYPDHSPDFGLEMSSDNVTDNGRAFVAQPSQERYYRWETVETTDNDDPRSIWSSTYTAIGTANEALAALDKLPQTEQTKGLRAEGLLCRAYCMFQLANTFCMAWNPDKANEYLGLPYPKVAGVSVDTRGTLAELYANINADIEAALPLLNDSYLGVPKYHFNARAAYAFAARFNLYYMNYDKAIEYANKVLGNNAKAVVRDYSSYIGLAGVADIANKYVQSGENANLMFVTSVSQAGRAPTSGSYRRFAHNYTLTLHETYWASMPWSDGEGSKNTTLYLARLLYGNTQQIRFPKLSEFFEVRDKISGTGFPHIVDAVFTTDETLLVRAEAYALKKDYTKALADMNVWAQTNCAEKRGSGLRPTFTETSINNFVNAVDTVPAVVLSDLARGFKKQMVPQGFTLEAGTQTNMLYIILQMRRIETMFQGLRFIDVKRYGIKISHTVDGEKTPLAFEPGDLRGAIQLPQDVITAGLQPNPRKDN